MRECLTIFPDVKNDVKGKVGNVQFILPGEIKKIKNKRRHF